MNVTYEVSDGYAGGSAPHHVKIDDSELAECETDEEREEVITDTVQEHFEEHITWHITNREESK